MELVRRTGVDGRDLASNYVLRPLTIALSQISEFTMVFWSTPEETTKRKDNKTVMGHNKHNNKKWNITRSPEFWIGDKSENGEQ